MLTPKVRAFLHRILRSVSVILAQEVYGKHRPQNASEARALVREYIGRGKPDWLPIVAMLGEHHDQTEFAILAGMLGLLEPQEPLGTMLQRLDPLWAEFSSLPLPQSIGSFLRTIRPHLRPLAVSLYSLAPHFALSKIRESIDEASDKELSEARIQLRNIAAESLRLRGARPYYRRFRKILAAFSDVFRRRKRPHRVRQLQYVLTREGLLAFATLALLHVRQGMREMREVPTGTRNSNRAERRPGRLTSDGRKDFAKGPVAFSALESASK